MLGLVTKCMHYLYEWAEVVDKMREIGRNCGRVIMYIDRGCKRMYI